MRRSLDSLTMASPTCQGLHVDVSSTLHPLGLLQDLWGRGSKRGHKLETGRGGVGHELESAGQGMGCVGMRMRGACAQRRKLKENGGNQPHQQAFNRLSPYRHKASYIYCHTGVLPFLCPPSSPSLFSPLLTVGIQVPNVTFIKVLCLTASSPAPISTSARSSRASKRSCERVKRRRGMPWRWMTERRQRVMSS